MPPQPAAPPSHGPHPAGAAGSGQAGVARTGPAHEPTLPLGVWLGWWFDPESAALMTYPMTSARTSTISATRGRRARRSLRTDRL